MSINKSVFSTIIFFCLCTSTFTLNCNATEGKEPENIEEEVEEKEPEEKVEEKKEYKNPFKELQRQRQIYEERAAKLKQQFAVKAGIKTKRKGGSNLEASVRKRIGQIDGKIGKKYTRYIKPYHSRITKLSKEIQVLNDRLKMTSASEKTMSRLARLENEIYEEKSEFYDKYVVFQPLSKAMLNKYKWAKY